MDMMNKNEIMTHINEHVKYPATKEDLVEACNNMSHVPDEDKKWFIDNLPEGQYAKSEDVMKALGMNENSEDKDTTGEDTASDNAGKSV